MTAVASLTDFNRNQNAVLADLRDTQKPMYLTKNGKACAVIICTSPRTARPAP